MISVRLNPLDTLFFRDGTPFSAGSSPQQDVVGLFPPYPPTMVGALRVALARRNGWEVGSCWPKHLEEVLGNGPADLGALTFEGPFVLQCNTPLFVAPRHVLGAINGEGQWVPRVLLRPGCAVKCDLGDAIRLPDVSAECEVINQCKAGDGCWLTSEGLQKVLDGDLPCFNAGHVKLSRELWSKEMRVGLERNLDRRAAEDSKLYSSHHVRLNRGISLGMRIGGVPSEWKLPNDHLVPFGGESRLASCEEWRESMHFNVPETKIEKSGHVTIIALSPLDLDEVIAQPGGHLDIPGEVKVISACLDRPDRIGGWDSIAHAPLPLRSVLPSGSVLFCQASEPKHLISAAHERNGLLRLGQRQDWGFGIVALGTWLDQSEVNS